MSVVRIRQDLYERVTKMAVKVTIELQEPIRQGEIINLLLEKMADHFTDKDLIREMKAQRKEKEEKKAG